MVLTLLGRFAAATCLLSMFIFLFSFLLSTGSSRLYWIVVVMLFLGYMLITFQTLVDTRKLWRQRVLEIDTSVVMLALILSYLLATSCLYDVLHSQ